MKCPNPNCPEKDGQPTIDSFHDETQFYCNECGHEWRYDGKPLKPVVTTTVPVKVVASTPGDFPWLNPPTPAPERTWQASWTDKIDPQGFLDECTAWLNHIEAEQFLEAEPDDTVHVKEGIEWFTSCQALAKQIYADGTYPEWRDELLAVMIRIGRATLGLEWNIEHIEKRIADDATGP